MSISLALLKEAVSIKEQIAEFEARLEKLLGGTVSTIVATVAPFKEGRRKMSASARAKIGAAQRLRWARQKGTVAVAKPGKKKRHLSAEGRAAIVAALKRRWAAKRK